MLSQWLPLPDCAGQDPGYPCLIAHTAAEQKAPAGKPPDRGLKNERSGTFSVVAYRALTALHIHHIDLHATGNAFGHAFEAAAHHQLTFTAGG